jgi:hypothetical protein
MKEANDEKVHVADESSNGSTIEADVMLASKLPTILHLYRDINLQMSVTVQPRSLR